MKIHLYGMCWNEEKILPFFLRHYAPLVDRFFIANDGSTDRTAEILASYPNISLVHLQNDGDSLEMATQKFSNHIWKHSCGEADWVLFCDMDEFLYHPNFRSHLKEAAEKGITVIPCKGFQMISDSFPRENEDLPKTITFGIPANTLSKTIVFNPNKLLETNFSIGRHTANPTGQVVYPDVLEIKLLHYKCLGPEYTVQRHAELGGRLRKIDLEKGYSKHHVRSKAEIMDNFEKTRKKSTEVLADNAPDNLVTGYAFKLLQNCRAELEDKKSEASKTKDVLHSLEKRLQTIQAEFAIYYDKTHNPFKLFLCRLLEPGKMRKMRRTIEAELKAINIGLNEIKSLGKKVAKKSSSFPPDRA